LLALALAAGPLCAQQANPTSAANPFYGSVTLQPATEDTLKLSLDEAIGLGLKNNLGLKEAEYGEKLLQGEKNVALQEFLPTILLSGATGVYQHDLAALGFGPSTIAKFGSKVPAGLSLITRDDLTTGQVSFSETLFSSRWPRPICTPLPPPAKLTTPRPRKLKTRPSSTTLTTPTWPEPLPIWMNCAPACNCRHNSSRASWPKMRWKRT